MPLNTETGYPATQQFARSLARLLSQQHPERVVDAMAKELRRGKVFVDWSQNSDHKTTVSVYSLRAKQERPFVSMPVTWEELRRAARKGDTGSLYFEAGEALARLKRKGDLFEPVLKLVQRLPDGFGTAFETDDVEKATTKRATRGYSHKRNSATAREPSRRTATPGSPPSRRRSAVQWHPAKP